MKLSYKPLSLKFNPSNQNFLAVAGIKDLEVFTLSKNGKVVSKLVVDLVLEALGEDLSIVNINWLPDSQTMLAVATREFVRIYDLSEDNISPKFNIEIHDNSITDFTFSKSRVNQFNIQTILTSVIVSTENGVVYHEEIAYSATGTASTEKENMMNIE
jgi:E3 ubiquitin-protein ligase UBR4